MKIFLGYASEHRDAAIEVDAFLQSLGHSVWFDQRSLTGGDVWNDERKAAQNDADFIVHLCSEEILQRKGVVVREIRHTLELANDQPFGKQFVVFMRLDDVSLPAEMMRFHYLDYRAVDWKERLAASVAKAERAEPPKIGSKPPSVPDSEDVSRKLSADAMVALKMRELTETTDSYECSASYPIYEAAGLFWESINAKITDLTLSEYFSCRSDFSLHYNDVRDGIKSEWSFNAAEFFREGELVSLRMHGYIYWSGAAHPNYYTRTLNFGGIDFAFLSIGNLLGHDDSAALRVLEYCERVIDAGFKSEQNESDVEDTPPFFDDYKNETNNIWKLIGQYNFDKKGLTINFSPYDVLPFVYGSHEVFVPWRVVESFVHETYIPLVEKIKGEKVFREVTTDLDE